MSSHNFHWHDNKLNVKWSDPGQCITFEVGESDVSIHAHGLEHIERLRRAFDAFQRELEREPVAQQAAE